jgi:hypothetical protein
MIRKLKSGKYREGSIRGRIGGGILASAIRKGWSAGAVTAIVPVWVD